MIKYWSIFKYCKLLQELIRRWDSQCELFLRRYRTHTSKYQWREPILFNE